MVRFPLQHCISCCGRGFVMTRINVVPVESLTREHLISEYRELPRCFSLAYKASQSSKPWTDKQPKSYRLGQGHVCFFYDKLGYLADRHKQLVSEMLSRGYKPAYTGCLRAEWSDKIPQGYWRGYEPDSVALAINEERITKRLAGDKT